MGPSDAAVIAEACAHFESRTKQPADLRNSRVIGTDDRGVIVRVCFGTTRPLRRAWYLVGSDGSVNELPFEAVTVFGEQPWR